MTKIGRNTPCPCTSGKKYKKCCGQTTMEAPSAISDHLRMSPSAGISKVTGLREVPHAVSNDDVDVLFAKMAAMPIVGKQIRAIREQKMAGTRSNPSATAILAGIAPIPDYRAALIDKVASLVDENQSGRSDMCMPFAALVARALNAMGITAVAHQGKVCYTLHDGSRFAWHHAWVTTGDVVIDGNIDSVQENPHPIVPDALRQRPPRPYWGPSSELTDRRFPSRKKPYDGSDGNLDDIDMWWSDLLDWMRAAGLVKSAT